MTTAPATPKAHDMNGIPKLRIRQQAREAPGRDPNGRHTLTYRDRAHERLPHVVKFSRGRSSAMLLFVLLENRILKQERGDVVVFNNTACEHPETYRFTAECKRRVEEDYGIPLFLTEFQTCEDARRGQWRRLPAYRLVNERPRSPDNPDGFHWRGEVFEELVSHKAYLPNRHRRVCTAEIKLGPTRRFLADWLANKPGIDALGHGCAHSRVDLDEMYKRHLRAGGSVPREILLEKRRFVLGRPPRRPAQAYADFSGAARAFDDAATRTNVFGRRASLGKGAIEYVVLIGLRGDEPLRIARVRARNDDPHARAGHDGEHVYMPFESMRVGRDDVNRFWSRQEWDLDLDPKDELSNCVYCFMKGARKLGAVHAAMRNPQPGAGFGSTTGTPCDIRWWQALEEKYGRDLVAENRIRRERDGRAGPTRIGFFGLTDLDYRTVAQSASAPAALAAYEKTVPACACTS